MVVYAHSGMFKFRHCQHKFMFKQAPSYENEKFFEKFTIGFHIIIAQTQTIKKKNLPDNSIPYRDPRAPPQPRLKIISLRTNKQHRVHCF